MGKESIMESLLNLACQGTMIHIGGVFWEYPRCSQRCWKTVEIIQTKLWDSTHKTIILDCIKQIITLVTSWTADFTRWIVLVGVGQHDAWLMMIACTMPTWVKFRLSLIDIDRGTSTKLFLINPRTRSRRLDYSGTVQAATKCFQL